MNSQMSAAERRKQWARLFDGEEGREWNCRPWLKDFANASFEYLEMLFGPAALPSSASRETLASVAPVSLSTWRITDLLRQLGLYGRHGVTDAHIPLGERGDYIDPLIDDGMAFLDASPIAQLARKTSNRRYGQPVDRVVRVAWNRKTLDDHGKGVVGYLDPSALAILGGVSEGRVRNLMSEGRTFRVREGLITAVSALGWLKDRPAFWNSIWQQDEEIDA